MHDADFVYMVIEEVVAFSRNFILSNLSKVHYFFDGCSGQYKNCKNYLNLCYHEHDFDVVCGLSLEQAMENPHVMALVTFLKGLQPELVFNDQ